MGALSILPMVETKATIPAKEMETKVPASLQDEIKNMEVKFQSQLSPM